MSTQSLQQLLDDSAQACPNQLAVEEAAGGQMTYHELARLSDRLRDRLLHIGIVPGDRVGICLPKSIDSLAGIFGILKAGGAYVPVDNASPPARNAYIFENCSV